MQILDKEVTIFKGKSADAPLVILNTYRNESKMVYQALCRCTEQDFSLAVISNIRWDDEMSPWPIPPIDEGDRPCTGGADVYLEKLEGIILPQIKKKLSGEPRYMALGGYSLAGLFAVYAIYRTSLFSRIASASGSLWFPGFVEYAKSHELKIRPDRLYLSLGDQEARTKNPYLMPVEKNTDELARFYEAQGIASTFELNPGNHHHQGNERMAKGVSWILQDV